MRADPWTQWLWLAVSIVVGCHSGDATARPVFAGCYELQWDLDSVLPPHLVPNLIVLRADSIGVGERGVVRRRVDRMFETTSQDVRGNEPRWDERFYNRWWQGTPDSVKLELMDEGHLLWEVWLGADHGTLGGHARLRSHARGLLTRGRLVARARTCVAP